MVDGSNYIIPFGQHKGKAIGTVPAGYLLFLYDNCEWFRGLSRTYVEENLEQLRIEAKEQSKKRKTSNSSQ